MSKIVYALTTCSNCKDDVVVEIGQYSGFDSVMNDVSNVKCINFLVSFKFELFKSNVISIEPKEYYKELQSFYPNIEDKIIHNKIVEILKKKLQ